MELSQLPLWSLLLLLALAVWTLYWKVAALWYAATHKEFGWFILFIFINTAGFLEIIYLFALKKVKTSELFSQK